MDGYNGFKGYNGFNPQSSGFDDDTSNVRLPKWVWIVGVVGLAFAILCGYYTGIFANEYVNEIIKEVIVTDTNGEENTTLNTLDFTNFLGIYDDYYGYNRFDAGLFTARYDSSALYDNSLGTYKNDYSKSTSTRLSVSFKNLNHYDVSYIQIYEGANAKLNYSVDFEIIQGNMEAAILRVAKDYKVKTDEFGITNIEEQYIELIERISSDKDSSVSIEDGWIYVIAFAGESATGSYSLSVSIY